MKAKLYRRLANKAIKRYSGFDLYKFWHFFKMECDKAIYEISYRTAFEPTEIYHKTGMGKEVREAIKDRVYPYHPLTI